MAMINSANLEGRLTRDVRLNHTKKNTPVTTFALANDRPSRKGNERTDFPIVTLWGKPAETLHKYAGKGSLISVSGRTQTRHYDNRNGRRVFVQEILANSMEMLKTKRPGQNNSDEKSSNPKSKPKDTSDTGSIDSQVNEIGTKDEDLPF